MQHSDKSHNDEQGTTKVYYKQTLSQILECAVEELGLFHDLEARFPGITRRTIEVAKRDSTYPTIAHFLGEAKRMALEGLKRVLTKDDYEKLGDVGLASDMDELKLRFVWAPRDSPKRVRSAGTALAALVYGDIDRKKFLERYWTLRRAGEVGGK